MVPTLTGGSGFERLSDAIKDWVGEKIPNLSFVSDLEINDPNRPFPMTDYNPAYSFRFQVLNETRGVPIVPVRTNFYFGIRRSPNADPSEYYNKLTIVRDQFHKLLRATESASRLQFRNLRMLNSSFQARQDLFLLLTQFEFKIFLKRGEY
jgi:hypothetical protein